jgi:LPXTG-motif cell wall-anchored protein
VINLVNIDAAITVVCVTGGSGNANGLATGGPSGSATLLAPGPAGLTASGGSGSVATSGMGGNAIAVISSGPTGDCILILVNIHAVVTVLCITGASGNASGVAAGGASGAALVAPAQGMGGSSAGGLGIAGAAGTATAVVTAGSTGNCGVSLTNTMGRISLLCRTGDSGSAQGEALGGDSGPALVMLNMPTAQSAVMQGALTATPTVSPFAPGGLPPVWNLPAPESVSILMATESASLATTGTDTALPLGTVAGLLLSGGIMAGATRRKRRFVRNCPI